jgi:hypothetical protein
MINKKKDKENNIFEKVLVINCQLSILSITLILFKKWFSLGNTTQSGQNHSFEIRKNGKKTTTEFTIRNLFLLEFQQNFSLSSIVKC